MEDVGLRRSIFLRLINYGGAARRLWNFNPANVSVIFIAIGPPPLLGRMLGRYRAQSYYTTHDLEPRPAARRKERRERLHSIIERLIRAGFARGATSGSRERGRILISREARQRLAACAPRAISYSWVHCVRAVFC